MEIVLLITSLFLASCYALRCYQCVSSKTSTTGSCVRVQLADEFTCPSHSQFCAKSNMTVKLSAGSLYEGLGVGKKYIMMRHCARKQDICPNNRPCRLTDIGDFTYLGKKFAQDILAKLLSPYDRNSDTQKVSRSDDDEAFGKECPRLDQFEIDNWHTCRCERYLCNNDPGYDVPTSSSASLKTASKPSAIDMNLHFFQTILYCCIALLTQICM